MRMKTLLASAAAIALLVNLPAHAQPAKSTVTGLVQVIDADTLAIGGIAVRLKGVDAMERDTPEGNSARKTMLTIVSNGETVTCTITGEKTQGREVGYCRNAGLDLNRAIIAAGAALACPRYDPRYLDAETTNARQRLQQASYCVVAMKRGGIAGDTGNRNVMAPLKDCEPVLPGGCDDAVISPPSIDQRVDSDRAAVRRGGGGCGSRGGPGYRLANGKCASWRDAR
jgi:endonuclease YncB( thermonuclease family)